MKTTGPDLLQIAMEHSESLIINARAGDEYAFNRLVSLWYKRIYNFCFKYFGSHDAAMEATQKTFISVHKSFHLLQSPDRFKSWLYRIALNKCHEEERGVFRKKMVSMFSSNEDGVKDQISAIEDVDASGPDRKLQKKELADLVTKCLNRLSGEQREVVIMKEYEGLKFREIAEALDISENTAKSRLYYGLTALRKLMTKMNVNQETLDYEL
ncbi:MAG: RNA polymerase sigma factor [Cyclobacteriaceae bacterium]|nr:RNA polymerase sigma factor [Cyclobacteriaceae bacterium]